MAPQVKALLAVKPDKLNSTFGTDMVEGKSPEPCLITTHVLKTTHIFTLNTCLNILRLQCVWWDRPSFCGRGNDTPNSRPTQVT